MQKLCFLVTIRRVGFDKNRNLQLQYHTKVNSFKNICLRAISYQISAPDFQLLQIYLLFKSLAENFIFLLKSHHFQLYMGLQVIKLICSLSLTAYQLYILSMSSRQYVNRSARLGPRFSARMDQQAHQQLPNQTSIGPIIACGVNKQMTIF